MITRWLAGDTDDRIVETKSMNCPRISLGNSYATDGNVRRDQWVVFLIIGVVLSAAYLLGIFAFHVTAIAMHAVLIGALAVFTLHFIRDRRPR